MVPFSMTLTSLNFSRSTKTIGKRLIAQAIVNYFNKVLLFLAANITNIKMYKIVLGLLATIYNYYWQFTAINLE